MLRSIVETAIGSVIFAACIWALFAFVGPIFACVAGVCI